MRLLVVEDDRQLLDAVATQLRHEGYEVDTAEDGEEGLYYLREGIYDVVLLDRMIPEMDGIAVLKKARAMGVSTPVLLLTALDRIGDRVDGLDAGADDYLTKPFDARELLARVRALCRRSSQIAEQEEQKVGDIALNILSLELTGEIGTCSLSKTEGELLEVLMKNAGQTLPRHLLFARVWGADSDVEEASLDSYAHFVRRRLSSVSTKVKLVTVRGVGYRLEEMIE